MSNKKFYPLYENEKIIKELFGYNSTNDILNDKLNATECKLANKILSEYLYGKEISNLLNNNDEISIMKIVQNLKNLYCHKLYEIEQIDFSKIAVLVVRPENIGLVDKYISFLNKLGLNLIGKVKKRINFEQYLLMYYKGLICHESRYDFPTRTLNYINKDLYILLFYSNLATLYPLSDYLTKIKGKQGKETKNTLRGDIAYHELKKVVDYRGTSFTNNEYNLLFDPIGMCRLLVRNEIESDYSHEIANLKLLYYVGQAVHVPNYNEIKDDFMALYNDVEIDNISQKIKKLQK